MFSRYVSIFFGMLVVAIIGATGLSAQENPLGLTLRGLKYNEERGVVSLALVI
jgi:hypothetical protein